MIADGVKSYVEGAHGGALLISGPWGTGKSFYVRHRLLGEIGRIPYRQGGEGDGNVMASRFVELISEENEGRNFASVYVPVMVSAFGKQSVAEIEDAVVAGWFDKVSRGYSKKVDRLRKILQKTVAKSKKINEWFDVSSLLEIKPGIASMPRNTVIVIDDLERYDEAKISASEMLGFLNNLTENLGFKVIVIANEDFMAREHEKLGQFKEKVIGKALMYRPDMDEIVENIIDGHKDEDFGSYMRDPLIFGSMMIHSPFAQTHPLYAEKLRNLRTLKFAIAHFHVVYRAIAGYAARQGLAMSSLAELLRHCWFTVLAVSLELKANKISCDDLRGLDTYTYVRYGQIDFGDALKGMTDDEQAAYRLFEPKDNPELESLKQSRKEKEARDHEYAAWFYQYYFKATGAGVEPVAMPMLLDFVVRGGGIDVNGLINEFERGKDELHPAVNAADKNLDELMTNFSKIDNETFEDNIYALFSQASEGGFSRVEAFVQAASLLFGYKDLIKGFDAADIMTEIKKGVDIWMSKNDVSNAERSRLDILDRMDMDPESREIAGYVRQCLDKKEVERNAAEHERLVHLFSDDTPAFCAQICPHGFAMPSGMAVIFAMNTPILADIPQQAVRDKIDKITLNDAGALYTLTQNRYSVAGLGDIKEPELPFWQTVCDTIAGYGDQPVTAGRIKAKGLLYPAACSLVGGPVNNELLLL